MTKHENCRGAVEMDDNVQVFGNEKIHDRDLHEAMEGTRKADIKLTFNKFIIKTKLVSLVACTFQRESSLNQGWEKSSKMLPPTSKQ